MKLKVFELRCPDGEKEWIAELCQACHLKYDLHQHIMRRKYGTDVYK